MKKVRIAVVGCGGIANVHLTSYSKLPNVEIYALCDINRENLDRTGDKFGIARRYTDEAEMLKECAGELDGVDVCVWNCNHAPCTIMALEAGLNVLCEKPMAYNTEQAIRMKEAADKAGKLLMVGFVLRFNGNTAIVKDFIDKGLLGDIYYSKAQYVRRHGNPGGWFGNSAKSGGGPVIDLGVHVIDLMRYLSGSPKPVGVYASVQKRLGKREHLHNSIEWVPQSGENEPFDVEDFGTALIRFDNGSVMMLETTYDINGEDVAKRLMYGTKGGVDFTNGVKIFGEYNNFLTDFVVNTENCGAFDTYHFDAEMAHFVDCIANGTPCRATAEDGIIVMKILDAIYESGRTGHEAIID